MDKSLSDIYLVTVLCYNDYRVLPDSTSWSSAFRERRTMMVLFTKKGIDGTFLGKDSVANLCVRWFRVDRGGISRVPDDVSVTRLSARDDCSSFLC